MASNLEVYKYQIIADIHYAKNLEDKKLIGDHAVYVAVDVLKETKRTRTIKDISNPKWNETLIFKLNEVPEYVEIRVRDDRMLLPNLNLGHYRVNIKDKILSFDPLVPTTLQNGDAKLIDSPFGELNFNIIFQDGNIPYLSPFLLINNNVENVKNVNDVNVVQGPYEEVKKVEFREIPEQVFDKVIVSDESIKNISSIENDVNVKNEYHVLPTIRVQEPPRIIEKEVEYIKPVEVHQTIIEKQIPKIIEKPIIVEKKEHYLESTEIKREENIIVSEKKDDNYFNSNVNEHASIENLRKEREIAFNNQTPIIEHKKEQIVLDTDIQEIPTEIRTKEVVYEQPIEIERKKIEKITPTIVEDVVINKEHVMEKEKPQIIIQDATVVKNKDHYYSQEEVLP